MKRKAWVVARMAIGIAIVITLIIVGDPARLTITLDARAWLGIVACTALLLLALGASAYRWQLVLGSKRTGVRALLRLYLIGWFCSLFLPTSVGGDAVRTVGLVRLRESTGTAISSIVVERCFGMAALVLMLVIGIVVAPFAFSDAIQHAAWSLSPMVVGVGLIAGLAMLVTAFVISRRWAPLRKLIDDALTLVVRFRGDRGRLVLALVASVIVQASYVAAWISLAWGLAFNVPFVTFLVFVPFVSLVTMLPVTISGLGIREGTWALFLAPFAVSLPDAVAFGLLYYLCSLAIGVWGGILFSASGLSAAKDAEPESERDDSRVQYAL